MEFIKRWKKAVPILIFGIMMIVIGVSVVTYERREMQLSPEVIAVPIETIEQEVADQLSKEVEETLIPEEAVEPEMEEVQQEGAAGPESETLQQEESAEPETEVLLQEVQPESKAEQIERMSGEEPEKDVVPTEETVKQETMEVHVCSFSVTETKATCLEAGYMKEICQGCGKINSEQKLDPLGHDFQKSIWETATCLKGGYYNSVCQRCGLVECTTEAPLSHDVEDTVIQEGNCMEDTIIRHVCRSCGQQVENDTRYTPQTHKWVQGVADGMEVVYCEWCGVAQ